MELKPIVGRLNELLGRIEGAFRRERRFTSNVAHELRTPIAELRALAEVAIACPRGEGADGREFGGDAVDRARQMQALVESLLAIAAGRKAAPDAANLKVEDLVLRQRACGDKALSGDGGGTAADDSLRRGESGIQNGSRAI